MYPNNPRVLLVVSILSCPGHRVTHRLTIHQNDDGPPGPESPYILGLYQHLTNHLGEHDILLCPHSCLMQSPYRVERESRHTKLPKVLDRLVHVLVLSQISSQHRMSRKSIPHQ